MTNNTENAISIKQMKMGYLQRNRGPLPTQKKRAAQTKMIAKCHAG